MALACLVTVTSAGARADEEPIGPVAAPAILPSTERGAQAEVRRLHEGLEIFASSARGARLTVVATGLATGVALVPTGIVLSGRSDEVAQSIGVGMTVAGSASLFFSLLSLRSSKMEQLARTFEERRTAGVSDEELVRATETAWSAAAESSHDRRVTAGVIALALGAASTASGLYMLLADPGVFGQSRNAQYNLGSLLVGPGVPFMGVGLRFLIQETPEETSWSAYRSMKGAPLARSGDAATSGAA